MMSEHGSLMKNDKEHGNLGEPVGAIWVKDFNLRKSIAQFLSQKHPVCGNCHELLNISIDPSGLTPFLRSHTLSVKVRPLKEKFIALHNRRKKGGTDPDYFLHVYQTHTGAAPSYPFRAVNKETPGPTHTTSTGEDNDHRPLGPDERNSDE